MTEDEMVGWLTDLMDMSLGKLRELVIYRALLISGAQQSASVIHISQFSCSVMSDSLRTHGLQDVRLPCPSSTAGIYPNSCQLSQ